MRISDWSSDVCSSDLAGQPHFSLDFRFGQTVAPEIFFKQLSVTDDEPGLAIQHILHPRKKISHPTQEETPKGKGNDRQRGPRYAALILSDPLLAYITHADTNDKFETRNMTKLAPAHHTQRQIQSHETKMSAPQDEHTQIP